jgi:hypothetical protein
MIQDNAIRVVVDNLPKRKRYTTTSIRTFILDPAGTGDGKSAQVASYEPTRVRMVIIPIDAAVALTLEVPSKSPDTGAAGTAPQGGYLPVSTVGWWFYGPDAWFLNSLTAITRVTVIKEYCLYGDA